MTGLADRLCGGPRELIKAMAVVQSQATSCPSSISQGGFGRGAERTAGLSEERTASFQGRRDLVVDGLNAIDGLDCPFPRAPLHFLGLRRRSRQGDRHRAEDRDGYDFCAFIFWKTPMSRRPGLGFRPLTFSAFPSTSSGAERGARMIGGGLRALS